MTINPKCPICGDSTHSGYDLKLVNNLYNTYHCDSNNNCAIVLIPTGKYANGTELIEHNKLEPDPENNIITLFTIFGDLRGAI